MVSSFSRSRAGLLAGTPTCHTHNENQTGTKQHNVTMQRYHILSKTYMKKVPIFPFSGCRCRINEIAVHVLVIIIITKETSIQLVVIPFVGGSQLKLSYKDNS